MKEHSKPALLFALAALYDGLLGMAFLLAPERVFALFDVTPPNHMGYVQFPAALLIVFAIMFAVIAYNPRKNRALIPYGVLLKVSYCGVVFWYWISSGIPHMWKPWAVIDLVFMVLFVWCYVLLGRAGAPGPEAAEAD